MESEYDRIVRQIEKERYAICAINAIFALLGIASWLGLSSLALSSLVLILVLNATFPFEHRRRLIRALRNRAEFDKVTRAIAYERYTICLINGIFALLGIVSWFGAPYLAFTALVLILVLNASFPIEHRRRLQEARSKQMVHRLKDSGAGFIGRTSANQDYGDKPLDHPHGPVDHRNEGLRPAAGISGTAGALSVSSAQVRDEQPTEITVLPKAVKRSSLALEYGFIASGIAAVIISALWANR
jgi:hypothetical protein